MLSNVNEYIHLVLRRAQVGLPPATAAPGDLLPADYDGVRFTHRFLMRPGVKVGIDRNAATLVDLSRDGAQVLVPKTVRPNQCLRMSMADEQGRFRCHGSIGWA